MTQELRDMRSMRVCRTHDNWSSRGTRDTKARRVQDMWVREHIKYKASESRQYLEHEACEVGQHVKQEALETLAYIKKEAF